MFFSGARSRRPRFLIGCRNLAVKLPDQQMCNQKVTGSEACFIASEFTSL